MALKRKQSEAAPNEYVFVRPREMGGAAVVKDPQTGHMVAPEPGKALPANHRLVKAYPWLFLTTSEMYEAQNATVSEARSVRVGHAMDPKEQAAEWARLTAENRAKAEAMTPKERRAAELDTELSVYGMRFEDDGFGSAVRFAHRDPHRDQSLYLRSERQWVDLFGLVEGARLIQASRGERAKALAARGVLTPDEEKHIRYISTAASPVDSVTPNTEPLSVEDARAANEHVPADGPAEPREYGPALSRRRPTADQVAPIIGDGWGPAGGDSGPRAPSPAPRTASRFQEGWGA
ncbi:hypothetical protein GCM10009557_11540 [Virgisporangium ochraceum]|uniref:Uncharacterized protein n=1 Tax=Virgisporangium ochraceum TaxID=65505 RepID=A0A8J4EFB5_9ACTN|nr:hypothetical protein [Virgisporangium ochraceum]GIJ69897.1 hypothetical protein Voc01_048140 [Virgisporangium ochraceum]